MKMILKQNFLVFFALINIFCQTEAENRKEYEMLNEIEEDFEVWFAKYAIICHNTRVHTKNTAYYMAYYAVHTKLVEVDFLCFLLSFIVILELY